MMWLIISSVLIIISSVLNEINFTNGCQTK